MKSLNKALVKSISAIVILIGVIAGLRMHEKATIKSAMEQAQFIVSSCDYECTEVRTNGTAYGAGDVYTKTTYVLQSLGSGNNPELFPATIQTDDDYFKNGGEVYEKGQIITLVDVAVDNFAYPVNKRALGKDEATVLSQAQNAVHTLASCDLTVTAVVYTILTSITVAILLFSASNDYDTYKNKKKETQKRKYVEERSE